MITGLEHVAIFAEDTAALKDWYVKVFEFKVAYDNGKGTFFLRMPDGSMIEICKQTEANRKDGISVGGLRHLAFYVDDFNEMVERLKAENVEVVTDATTSASGVSTFFFKDPEGNISHLINRKNPL